MSKTPRPVVMWAAIMPSRLGAHIVTDTIRHTRREARRAYEAFWTPEFAPQAVKEHRITFRRVRVEVLE